MSAPMVSTRSSTPVTRKDTALRSAANLSIRPTISFLRLERRTSESLLCLSWSSLKTEMDSEQAWTAERTESREISSVPEFEPVDIDGVGEAGGR
ncbi:hypothetical protein KPH14_000792 [Odynerus spinipes]|uniref:Uncharacterized protein n=1 Tax=Odynerus spinipes TaxID=1348599 RepID=A0AAD9RGP6_9HYME|nr:hypothetical protein KPH14_000792 [Odynerus spinipes]